MVSSTGERVTNDSGMTATSWTIMPAGFLELEQGR
jgi:hypothetical protein